jgi:hypothetical protein
VVVVNGGPGNLPELLDYFVRSTATIQEIPNVAAKVVGRIFSKQLLMPSYRGPRTPAEDQRNQKKNRPFEHPSAARLSEVLGSAEQDHSTANTTAAQ